MTTDEPSEDEIAEMARIGGYHCRAYKLLRRRKNGTLGPLFINRRQVIPIGVWLPAEDHPTKGYARRPGWHVAPRPDAPHLGTKGRVWMQVEVSDFELLPRPKSQGGMWMIARQMRVLENARCPSAAAQKVKKQTEILPPSDETDCS